MISRATPQYIQVAGTILANVVTPQSAATLCGDDEMQNAAVNIAIALTDKLFARLEDERPKA